MKKVLFVFDRVMHYHRDTFLALERELEARGFEFILFSSQDKPGSSGRVAYKGKIVRKHEYFRLTEKKFGTFTIRYQHALVPLVERFMPDIVVSLCHSGTLSEWHLASLKKRYRFRLIAWQCGYEFNPCRLKRWVLGKFIPRFDHHLAYHTNARDYAIAHGARPDQVTVMHNSINEAAIVCMPRDDARKLLAERWPCLAGKQIVLYVGAVLEEKRLEVVFDALDILKREDVVFVLVGDGPHLGAIKSRYGRRQDFLSTGQIVEGVGPYFDAARMYLLPGTGGLGINEAMAHSLPIISGYADGSADDLVVDGENGYRLRDGSPAELADRMARILDQPALAATMGETSREWITGKFAFRAFVDRIVTTLVAQVHP